MFDELCPRALLPMALLGLLLCLVPAAGRAAQQAWTSLGLSGGGGMMAPAISPADPNWMIVNCDMSGAYQSLDGGKTWQMFHHRQLVSNTRVPAAFHPTDPKVAFKLSGWDGGFRQTVDKGATWQEVPGAPRDITAIAFDPGHPDTMFLGTREHGVYRSVDGGKTWTAGAGLSGPVVGLHIDQTSRPEARTCFAATDQRLFRSDDGGATWTDTGASFGNPIVAFSAGSNPKTRECVLYCSTQSQEVDGKFTGGLLRSDDRGVTWTRIMGKDLDLTVPGRRGGPPRPAQYEYVLTTDVDPSVVYTARYYGGRIFRSDDRGATWRSLINMDMNAVGFNVGPDYLIDERGGAVDNASGFNINPANPDHLIVTGWMACNTTADGGKTWAVGHTRSAEKAGRRGPGLRWLNTGLVVTTVWHYYLDPFEPVRHYIAYTDIGYARSTDAGKTWYWDQRAPLRNTTYELAFDPEIPGKIWAACSSLHDIPNNNVISGNHYRPNAGGGVALSADFGVTWTDTSQGLPGKPIVSVVVDPKSPKQARTLYASAFEAGVYKSTDGGQLWTRRSDGLGAPGVNVRVCRLLLHRDGTLFCLVTALRGEDRQYLAEGPGLYRSRDGAEHWEKINASQPLLWPKDFDVHPRDSKVIYLGASDAGNDEGGLYKTTDGGATWTRVARQGRDCFGATISKHNPDWVYMCLAEGADETGLWLSKDAGRTWKPLEGLPFLRAQRVAFDPADPSVIYVSTFGGSVWKGPAE